MRTIFMQRPLAQIWSELNIPLSLRALNPVLKYSSRENHIPYPAPANQKQAHLIMNSLQRRLWKKN
jgi:hypothetical protein